MLFEENQRRMDFFKLKKRFCVPLFLTCCLVCPCRENTEMKTPISSNTCLPSSSESHMGLVDTERALHGHAPTHTHTFPLLFSQSPTIWLTYQPSFLRLLWQPKQTGTGGCYIVQCLSVFLSSFLHSLYTPLTPKSLHLLLPQHVTPSLHHFFSLLAPFSHPPISLPLPVFSASISLTLLLLFFSRSPLDSFSSLVSLCLCPKGKSANHATKLNFCLCFCFLHEMKKEFFTIREKQT